MRVLGVGGTGIVYELLHKTNGQRFAMKEMEIKNKTQMQMAISEAEMLKDIMENISHPNIMHIEKVFQVGSKFYLVFPLCTGGELYEHIIRRGHFTERDAAKIIHDIISGLHALHQHDILHLDIKPENILFDSMADDATIKITDFGLAKVFTNIVETQSQPTAELMAEKLKAFAESGELNRERLRGTVGYMSPELILTGHCSKATDVFAAGVVLYILLCGRPPFHSKSNREVLEKTAKGVYKLTGPEWDEVSEEAKDLVRKMLVSNPDERISTQDILDHSWIKESCQPLVEDQDGSIASSSNDDSSRNSSIGALSRDPSNPSRSTTLQKKVSTGTNLSGALKLLSGHVQKMRSEKLETNVTRLVSMLQQGGRGSSSLADKYLIPIDTFKDIIVQPIDSEKDSKVGTSAKLSKALSGGGVPNKRSGYIDSAVCEQELLNALSGELKQAIVAVVGAVGENNGKLSIEQFLGILRHLGYIPRQSLANGVNLAPLIACKFIDRDGDGYISPDDLFTTHAQVFQRSEAFLRMVFRVYIETVWYPGRQINLISWMQHMPLKASTTAGVVDNSSPDKEISRESNGFKVLEDSNHLDVVEPPKYITARHVSALFEKMGYDPQCGQKVFAILCEAIERIKQKERAEFEANGGKSYYNMRGADDRLSNISESSSKESLVGMDEVEVARGSINSKRNSAASLPVPPPLSTPNAALAAAFGDISMNEQIDQSRNSDAIPQKNSVSSIRNRTTSQSHGNAGDKTNDAEEVKRSGDKNTAYGAKMDVEDFLRY